MKYVLVGDTKERKERQDNLIDSFGGTVYHIYQDDLKSSSIQQLVPQEDDLFGATNIYVLHSLARDLDLKKTLEEYAHNSHIIIFLEDSLLKKPTEIFHEYSIIPETFKKETPIKQSKKIFDLAASFGARDKKNTWLLFGEAMQSSAAEEVHGILLWQLKNIILVKRSVGNPGLSPYVFKKTQVYAAKFSDSDCTQAVNTLVHMFHNRDRYSTLEIELELFILSFL